MNRSLTLNLTTHVMQNLVLSIFCESGWKERRNPNSWWHKTSKYWIVVHHEFWKVPKIYCLLFVYLFWCVLFVCKFMVFEVCNSMKMMNLCVGFGGVVSLLLQMSSLFEGRMRITLWKFGWRKEELKEYKKKSLGLQGQLSFLNYS